MDAQCLLLDGAPLDEKSLEGEEEMNTCCICGGHDGSRERQLHKQHPCRVPLVLLRDACRNKVLRGCARFVSLCIAVLTLVIGVLKKEQCPYEPAIPVFLLVDGSIITLHTVITTAQLCRAKKKTSDPEVNQLDNLGILLKVLILFLVLWNMAGSVWIYSVEKVVQFHFSVRTNYCDVTAYYVAYGLVTSAYVIVALILVLILLTVIFLYGYRMCTVDSLKQRTPTKTDSLETITHI